MSSGAVNLTNLIGGVKTELGGYLNTEVNGNALRQAYPVIRGRACRKRASEILIVR